MDGNEAEVEEAGKSEFAVSTGCSAGAASGAFNYFCGERWKNARHAAIIRPRSSSSGLKAGVGFRLTLRSGMEMER